MRIPQHYHSPGWQRFIAGFVIGIIVGWTLFITLAGIAQEQQINKIKTQQQRIERLEKDLKDWQKDTNEKNEELEQKLTVQEIKIEIPEQEDIDLTKLQRNDLTGEVRDQLSSLKQQDIEYVIANREVIRNLIEKQIYTIEKNKYQLSVQFMGIWSTITIVLDVEKVN